jgi:hypothetical protein
MRLNAMPEYSAAKGWREQRKSEAITHCTQSRNVGLQAPNGALPPEAKRLDRLDGRSDAVSGRYERRESVDSFSN